MYLQNHILYYIRIVCFPEPLSEARTHLHSFERPTHSLNTPRRSARIRFASSRCLSLRKYHVFRSSVHVCKHPFSLSRHPCCFLRAFGQALDLLVTVSCMRYRTSTSALSTLSSSRGLTAFAGISHLEGGFTLRCLQRLSRPDLATRPCSW